MYNRNGRYLEEGLRVWTFTIEPDPFIPNLEETDYWDADCELNDG